MTIFSIILELLSLCAEFVALDHREKCKVNFWLRTHVNEHASHSHDLQCYEGTMVKEKKHYRQSLPR